MGNSMKVGLTFYAEDGQQVLAESKFDSTWTLIPENIDDAIHPCEEFLDETSQVLADQISIGLRDKIREMLSQMIKGE